MEGLILESEPGGFTDVARPLVRATTFEAIRDAHALNRPLWVEIGERTDEGVALLLETFGLHPLVVEDIFSNRPSPKINACADYLYIVVYALRPTAAHAQLEFVVLDVVVGKTFVITQHRDGEATARMRARLERTPTLLARGSAWVAHAFIDAIVDRYLPRMRALAARVDDAEMRVLGPQDRAKDVASLLPELVALRRTVQAIHRIAHHQRELLGRLAQAELSLIPVEARAYFLDVYEHFSRVAEEADRCMDMMTNVIDAHFNMQSNRMNATVERLTLLSTVMLPLNLIASFYGMNFVHTPEFGWRDGRAVVLGVMFLTTLGIWTYFKRKRWT